MVEQPILAPGLLGPLRCHEQPGDRDGVHRPGAYCVRGVLGTLPPFGDCLYYTEVGETLRQALNAWILTNKDVNGLIDFDRVLRDPTNPKMFDPRYDSGDQLHPNDAGYAAMAESVRLVL
ncbi:MAG TPA: SGNH/GDSL hydrolase family protein [Polyangiales bacterium]|nr:SGNH/GDSL hydrolase family protein [Polyangiales bacterium]